MNIAIITATFDSLDHRDDKSRYPISHGGGHTYDCYHFNDGNTKFDGSLTSLQKELYLKLQPHKIEKLAGYDAWVFVGNAYRSLPQTAIPALLDEMLASELDYIEYDTAVAISGRILCASKNSDQAKNAMDILWDVTCGESNPPSFIYKTASLKLPAEIKLRPFERSINIFWHICMINHYREIIAEQLKLIIESGLYDAVEKIFLGCAGHNDELNFVREFIQDYDKIVIQTHKALHDFEFSTLNLVETKCKQLHDRPSYGLYIHTKGVSYKNNEGGKHWLDYMNYYNITEWTQNLQRIQQGYDLCGVKLLDSTQLAPIHYSGNFFWFDSEYVKTLRPVDSLNKINRYDAEIWICSGKPLAATLCQTFVDYNTKGPFVPKNINTTTEAE